MTTPLFDYAELRRIADALEGLLALARAHVTPAAPAPADFDSAQYADAFDAKMGDPLAALGRLTPFATPAAGLLPSNFFSELATAQDIGPSVASVTAAVATLAAKPFDDGRLRIRWSKYDLRCRELARLRTDAKHRAAAAKTPEQRAAALVERNQAKSEANRRQAVLRQLFWSDDVVDFVKGELVVFFGDGGTAHKWRSEYLQAPDYILTFTK